MITLTNQHNTQINQQQFILFTEAIWNEQKDMYKSSVQQFFSGKKNEVFVVIDDQVVKFLIGIGKNTAEPFEFQEIAQKFSCNYKKNIIASSTQMMADWTSDEQLTEFIKGLYLGTYTNPFQENHVFWNPEFQLIVSQFSDEELPSISKKINAICKGQFAAMDWLNKPANYKKVHQLTEYIETLSTKYHWKTKIYNRQQCETLGLGAFLSVNQGSSQEAAFTIIQYQGDPNHKKNIGLIGKCVLFDTGGISIKPSDNMHYMKSDMGGATAVLGSLITASELQIPVNIIAILPITDNAVANNAYLPSDVITAYNGKTIEVLNTDAEGRMTLADALSYLTKNYNTDVLIDLATLTGSSVRMFGNTCGALFVNNKELKNALISAADYTNQRLWNMPLWDIWKDDINSDVADLKNISMKPFGDCIVAAKFLENFTDQHPSWAHLDIAGVAFGNVHYAKEKAATGYGVQLLTHFLENF